MMALQPRTILGEGPEVLGWWWAPLSLAVAVAVFGLRLGQRDTERRLPWGTCSIGLAVGAAILAMALKDRPVLSVAAGLAALASAMAASGYTARRAARLFALAGAWALAAAGLELFSRLEARYDLASVGAWLVAPVLGPISGAHTDRGSVFLTHDGATQGILATPDKFGGPFIVAFLVAFLSLSYAAGMKGSQLLRCLGLIALYSALRTGAVMHRITLGEDRWWHEWYILASFVPLLLMLCLVRGRAPRPAARVWPRWLVPAGLAAGVLIGAGTVAHDPGRRKDGRVLVDACYSDWEWVDTPLDLESFGVKTVYNYGEMVDHLGDFYDVAVNTEEITDETLDGVSILILKTPTRAYPQQAKEAIWRFVERGGGVWCISDHTNVFGMSGYLNDLTGSQWGIRCRFDAVIDPDSNRQLSRPNWTSHPVIRDIGLFQWLTGCSLEAPFTATDIIRTPRLLRDAPDFSVNTGFGDFKAEPSEHVGSVLQAVSVSRKRGRVAVWSDSTVFSNFGIFLPGRFELALGYVEWLNRANSVWRHIFAGVIALGFAGAAATVFIARRSAVAFVAVVGVGVAGGVAAGAAVNGVAYPPQSVDSTVDVWVMGDSARRQVLPSRRSFNDPSSRHYWSSFVAIQRCGLRPIVIAADELGRCDTGDTILVIGDPEPAIDAGALLEHAAAGGLVILLDGGAYQASLLRSLCGLLDVELDIGSQRVVVEVDGMKYGEHTVAGTLKRDAQHTLLPGPDGALVAAYAVGDGAVILSTTSTLWSDLELGMNSEIPDGPAIRLYYLLRDILAYDRFRRE